MRGLREKEFYSTSGSMIATAVVSGVLLASLMITSVNAATAVSRIFGAVPVVAQGGSDTTLAVPMKMPAVFRAAVASTSGSTITFAGSPDLSDDQFVYEAGSQPYHHYVFFESGALAGRHFEIIGNAGSSVTIETGDLSAADADDLVAVHPFWTLATLFSSDQGLPVSAKAGQRPAEVIVASADADGVNPAAEAIYYERDGAWRKVGAPFESTFDDVVIEPDRPVTVRLNQESDSTLVMTGEVIMTELAVPVRARADGPQDNLVGLGRPLDLTLDSTGLGGGAAFETTTDLGAIKDRVILHSAEAGQNQLPTESYFYYNGGWRKEGADASTDYGDTVLPAGQGFVIRKAAQGGDSTTYWVNTFNPQG